eukprot:s1890_g3.t1
MLSWHVTRETCFSGLSSARGSANVVPLVSIIGEKIPIAHGVWQSPLLVYECCTIAALARCKAWNKFLLCLHTAFFPLWIEQSLVQLDLVPVLIHWWDSNLIRNQQVPGVRCTRLGASECEAGDSVEPPSP